MSQVVSVAVPVPALDVLSYLVPPGMSMPAAGTRVSVPLGTRIVIGCVVPAKETEAAVSAKTALKTIIKILDSEPLLPADVISLALWVGEYYACGPGLAISAALPPLKGARSGFKSIQMARGTPTGFALLSSGEQIGAKQRAALEWLQSTRVGVPLAELVKHGIPRSSMHGLVAREAVTIDRQQVERDPWATEALSTSPSPEHTLTEAQQAAIDALTHSAGTGVFEVALLHGVTGSGKTEVYLRLAQATLDRGRQTLILVPEIALTPGVVSRVRAVFGDRVALQHSGLSEGARHDQWHRIKQGAIDIVVGTRSAVFSPLPALGLVIVDEEHDGSYKQEESPRYHARDVAIMRGKQSDALVILGSATPSLETYRHAVGGRYRHLTLPDRVEHRPLPDVQVVDMREELAVEGPDVVLSRALTEALADRLEKQEQALVLLNRRGFATALFCRECGHNLVCPNCSLSLTYHRGSQRARCHYCGYARRRPTTCPDCDGAYLEQVGFGTERVEAEIVQRWPDARVARLDRDTVRRRGAAVRLLERFAAGRVDILVGTQMVAKGHDFPQVTLVGVISADVGLGLADFRAAERTFQLLTQVAGRAGRGARPGQAIVQTLHPDHYSIQCACHQAYGPFYDQEIKYREALRYPPVVSMVNVVVRSADAHRAWEGASELARRLRQRRSGFMVMGPASAPLERLRGQYRVQLFLKGPHRREMREALRGELDHTPELKRRTVVDIDPLTML